MGEKGQLNIHLLKPVLAYIKERNYIVTGVIRGEILARVHQGNQWKRYMELKIPIKN